MSEPSVPDKWTRAFRDPSGGRIGLAVFIVLGSLLATVIGYQFRQDFFLGPVVAALIGCIASLLSVVQERLRTQKLDATLEAASRSLSAPPLEIAPEEVEATFHTLTNHLRDTNKYTDKQFDRLLSAFELAKSDAGSSIKVLNSSSRVQPAWTIARVTLEKYWNRNLSQNGAIFTMSVVASAFGFCVMLWGVYAALHDNAPTSAAILAAASGAVAQVIGATFLVIYRSTAEQASDFNHTLERINSVGMAWYILQTMSEETPKQLESKDAARAMLVGAIASHNASSGSEIRKAVVGANSRARRQKTTEDAGVAAEAP